MQVLACGSGTGNCVTKVSFILAALICGSPAILLHGGLISSGIVAGILAVALTLTSISLRPGEAHFLASAARSAFLFIAIPALWILFQVCPVGILAHPIWTSAGLALGHSTLGTISIDPGTTVIGLGQYVTLCVAAFVSAAVAIDRRRATWVLFALIIASVIDALLVLTHDWLLSLGEPFARTQALECALVGIVVVTAAIVRIFDRYSTGRSRGESKSRVVRALAISAVALMICFAALFADGSSGMFIAAGCGVATLICVLIVRWFGLRLWGTTALVVPIIGIAFVVAANQPAEHGKSLLLAFAQPSSTSSTTMSERVLEDAPFLGTGWGTFADLAPIYRQANDRKLDSDSSTTAAAFAIELGRPLFWLTIAAILIAIFFLLKASLQRGRDWFYPAMGAGCLIALSISAFVNSGLLGIAPGLITVSTLGLAYVQSKSRTAGI
jgi:hypothetical protein